MAAKAIAVAAEAERLRSEDQGGEGRNRTGDTTVFSRVLYQLSYLAKAVRVYRRDSAVLPVPRAEKRA